uniref:Pentatricopeptide repeat-containing protein At5g15980, mitochondrial n=1 Tax=Anthurium amnicola TaxID=1678845 RepID=A0A1D1XKF6_9ARAE
MMRSAWRALLLRGPPRRIPTPAGSAHEPLSDLQVRPPIAPGPGFLPNPLERHAARGPGFRRLSSEAAAVDANGPDHSHVIGIFSGASGPDEIQAQLESAGISMDHGAVNSVLRRLGESPQVARRVFGWVTERENGILSSKSYNLMLQILGAEGKSTEFWNLLEGMKKKGYGLSKNTFLKVSKSFDDKGMVKDLGLLKEIYDSNSPENYVTRMSARIYKVLREGDELGDGVWRELKVMDISLSPDLVVAVLDRLCMYPTKAFLFFRWAIDNPSFEVDGRSCNVMARVLGREDCIQDFWTVLKEMRDGGHDLESETYAQLSKRFSQRKMMKEAVDLYEYAMGGVKKPPPGDFSCLLQKVTVSKELDVSLISRLVRVFIGAGYTVKDSVFNGVVKSLAGVGRLEECDKLLKAIVEGGFVANTAVCDTVVVGLSNAGRLDEATRFLVEMECSGHNLYSKTWASLIQRYSLAASTEKALSCFHSMVERKGGENAGCAFDSLVIAFCQKNKDVDACKVLTEMVDSRQLQPWHRTYKFLIGRLLSKGKLKEASGLLGLMKRHGFPPFIDPFIDHISEFGNGEDAVVFLKAMTVKNFPSISVFIRTFEALLKAGRQEVAHDLLSKSPGYVRSHADILSLFFSMKSPGAMSTAEPA